MERLRESVDMIVVVSNDQLLRCIPPGVSLADSFALADEVLRQGIVGLADIVTKPGLVNIDFADVRSIVADSGLALMGVGRGAGAGRAAARRWRLPPRRQLACSPRLARRPSERGPSPRRSSARRQSRC